LLEKETLDAEEIKALMEGKPLPIKKESPLDGTEDQADQSGDNQADGGTVDAGAEDQDSALNGDLKEEKIKVISKKPDRRASFARRSKTKEKPD
jgi:hypothetical protein